jgi:hypothetical protein
MNFSNYESQLSEYKKEMKTNKTILLVFLLILCTANIYYLIIDKDYEVFEAIIFFFILVAISFFVNYSLNSAVKNFINTETIIYIYKEIEERTGYSASRSDAMSSYYENTHIKFDSKYHTERHLSPFGYTFVFAESDLKRILENMTNEDVLLASQKYYSFNHDYVSNLILKIKSNKENQDMAWELKKSENKKWDRMWGTFAKGQGISKEELYNNLEEKENELITQKELINSENEKIDRENQRNSTWVLTSGTCPFCKNKVSIYATKCPTCTGDIIKSRKI